MHDNPRFEANEDGANRQLPEGVVARGSLRLNPSAPVVTPAGGAQPGAAPAAPVPAVAPAGAAPATPPAGAVPAAAPTGEDGFPFQVTKAILDRGESRFRISCQPCHGPLGDGNGMIVQRGFRRPPSWHEERLRKAPSSHFYDVMTNGFGAMPSYSDQLTPEDRWKVAAYLRVLQLSQRAEFALLPDAEKREVEKVGGVRTAPATPASGARPAPAATPAPRSAPTSGGHGN
jgi:mono/diheme cytochrome c family protein